MSSRSLANGNLTLNNLTLNGSLTMNSELEINNLDVSGNSQLNDVSCNNIDISGIITTPNGIITLPTTQVSSVYLGNTQGVGEIDYGNPAYTGFMTGNNEGYNEVDFYNLGASFTQTDDPAFDWFSMQTSTTPFLLMRLYNSGALYTESNLDVNGNVSSNSLSVSGSASMGTTNINGNLTVTGTINDSNTSQVTSEVVTYSLGGNASEVTETLALQQNTTGTTDYIVIPSIYYGFSGSGGTYNAYQTSSAIDPIVISNITDSSFQFNLTKTTGDNTNVILTFLVMYNVPGSNYNKSY